MKQSIPWTLNTSNPSKRIDFKKIFLDYGGIHLEKFTSIDLPEINSNPIDVVVHKAEQLNDYVIVEDTSFEIENAHFGVNIKWLIHKLKDHIGHKALLRTLIAYKENNIIYVFEGLVQGRIVPPKGSIEKGFNINPYFLPENSNKTLAEFPHDKVNPRAKAVKKFLNGQYTYKRNPIGKWTGQWQ